MGKKLLFMPVGTGKNIEQGIIKSIKYHNPDIVIFLTSEESYEQKHELIENEIINSGLKFDFKWEIINDPYDFEKCFERTFEIVYPYIQDSKRASIDITFGTKPMTASLAFLAVKLGTELSYVTGSQRDEHGKVISGTERVLSFEPVTTMTKFALNEAVKFFNKKLYHSTIDILRQHKELIAPKHKLYRRIEALMSLAELQIARENFECTIALNHLAKLRKFVDELSYFLQINNEKIHKFLENVEKAFNSMAEDSFSSLRLSELIASAERAAYMGRYNDAVARIYRAIEFIGQYKLKEKGLIDKDMFVTCRVVNGKCEKVENYKEKPVGLIEIYRCLYYLGEKETSPLVFDPQTNQPAPILSLRNKSILAHGFKSITKEDYEKMKELVTQLASSFGLSIKPVIHDLELSEELW